MLFNSIFELLARLPRLSLRYLLQPFLTAVFLTCVYGGYHIFHESSFMQGLKVAFYETEVNQITRLRERQDALLQGELHHMATSNLIIDKFLQSIVDRDPTIARARLDVIHNGVMGMTGTGLLRYDVTNSVPSAGHAAGRLAQNQALTEWSDFLPDLLQGNCALFPKDEHRGEAIRSRPDSMNAGTFLVCPVADVQGRLLGAVFVMWDAGTPAAEKDDMYQLIGLSKKVGSQIGAILDLGIPMVNAE